MQGEASDFRFQRLLKSGFCDLILPLPELRAQVARGLHPVDAPRSAGLFFCCPVGVLGSKCPRMRVRQNDSGDCTAAHQLAEKPIGHPGPPQFVGQSAGRWRLQPVGAITICAAAARLFLRISRRATWTRSRRARAHRRGPRCAQRRSTGCRSITASRLSWGTRETAGADSLTVHRPWPRSADPGAGTPSSGTNSRRARYAHEYRRLPSGRTATSPTPKR